MMLPMIVAALWKSRKTAATTKIEKAKKSTMKMAIV